jgi:cytochrome b561
MGGSPLFTARLRNFDAACSGRSRRPKSSHVKLRRFSGAFGSIIRRSQDAADMTSNVQMPIRYDSMTIRLHWATAILVAFLWLTGQTADFFPRGPIRDAEWSIHVVFGFLLGFILVARLAWRIGRGRRAPPADVGILGRAASLTHGLLYALLATAVTLGMANAFVRGINLFGVWSLPQIGDPALRRDLTEWHELAANLTMILALVHAGAALAHHYVWRDGVLQRMMPPRDGRPVR